MTKILKAFWTCIAFLPFEIIALYCISKIGTEGFTDMADMFSQVTRIAQKFSFTQIYNRINQLYSYGYFLFPNAEARDICASLLSWEVFIVLGYILISVFTFLPKWCIELSERTIKKWIK